MATPEGTSEKDSTVCLNKKGADFSELSDFCLSGEGEFHNKYGCTHIGKGRLQAKSARSLALTWARIIKFSPAHSENYENSRRKKRKFPTATENSEQKSRPQDHRPRVATPRVWSSQIWRNSNFAQGRFTAGCRCSEPNHQHRLHMVASLKVVIS